MLPVSVSAETQIGLVHVLSVLFGVMFVLLCVSGAHTSLQSTVREQGSTESTWHLNIHHDHRCGERGWGEEGGEGGKQPERERDEGER